MITIRTIPHYDDRVIERFELSSDVVQQLYESVRLQGRAEVLRPALQRIMPFEYRGLEELSCVLERGVDLLCGYEFCVRKGGFIGYTAGRPMVSDANGADMDYYSLDRRGKAIGTYFQDIETMLQQKRRQIFQEHGCAVATTVKIRYDVESENKLVDLVVMPAICPVDRIYTQTMGKMFASMANDYLMRKSRVEA